MKVRDFMIPIEEYAKVGPNASLYDALIALKSAQERLAEQKAPHRSVLVEDDRGNLVGNIGQLSFIKAMGADFSTPGAKEEMDKAGVSPGSISTVMNHIRFLYKDRGSLQARAKSIRTRNVMHLVGKSIDENASLQEAIDLFGSRQALSLLVKQGTRVVGVLRAADLFQEMAEQITTSDEDLEED